MMTILWSILSTLGLLATVWYLSCIFNPHGKLNYPMILWKRAGHYVSWVFIVVGIASLIGLFISINDLSLFLRILMGIFVIVLAVKLGVTPLEMPFNDVMGSLHSMMGLRFGGFQTSDFLESTEPLEKKQPGIREKIIGEAHYLVQCLHNFPEIAFFFGIVFYKSLWVALLLFVIVFILEIIRFYVFGTALFLSQMCRFWSWIKAPIFIIAAINLWPESSFLSIVLIIFLIVQGWFDLVASIGMLPIRLIACRIIYNKYGGHWHNMEGMAMNFVINRWRLKLFPADRFNVDN